MGATECGGARYRAKSRGHERFIDNVILRWYPVRSKWQLASFKYQPRMVQTPHHLPCILIPHETLQQVRGPVDKYA